MSLVRKLKKVLLIPQNFEKTGTSLPWKEAYITNYLWSWNPRLNVDNEGNLFILNPGTPLICAHMDTVQTEYDVSKIVKSGLLIKDGIIKSGGHKKQQYTTGLGGVLGGDDRCGVALAMELYEKYGDTISILFTSGEETGMDGARCFLKENKEYLDGAPYCLVLDRMGPGDIIGYNNSYCSQEFEDAVYKIMKPHGYKPAHGIGCDANVLRTAINCVNLSVGYMYHHQQQEQIVIKDFKNAFEAISTLLENLEGEFPLYTPAKPAKSWNEHNENKKQTRSKKVDRYGDEDEYPDIDDKEITSEENGKVGDIFTVDGRAGELIVHEPMSIYNHKTQKTIDIPEGTYLYYENNGWNS